MVRRKTPQIAKPTIAEVLSQFLAEQRERLAPSTVRKYDDIVGLLQHSLDSYACNSLSGPEGKLFERYYNATGDEHREFCEIFGPEHILPNISEFLDYFMVRKVIAGKDTMRAAGTVTKKLARWLARKGFVESEEAEDAAHHGAEAARDLPAAHELAWLFDDFADDQADEDADETIEGHFMLTRVDRGKVWLEEALGGRAVGPIAVPDEIGRRCRAGWTISGIVGRAGKRWRFVETWNVYPG